MNWKDEKPSEYYPKKCPNCGGEGFFLGGIRFCPEDECGWELEPCKQDDLPPQLVREHVKQQRDEKKRKKELWENYLKAEKRKTAVLPQKRFEVQVR